MNGLTRLITNTFPYKAIQKDLESDKLSHAYLILTEDQKNLKETLKIFAKLIMGKSERDINLIDGGTHPDVIVFPKNGETVLTDDVNTLIEQSYIKPIEGDKKLFVICGADSMSAICQNKLLKTLEEPPKNVCILLGAVSEYPLLSTVKSRIKKYTIPTFKREELYNVLKDEYKDEEKLSLAISSCDGILGKAESLYLDENLSNCYNLVIDTLKNMKSSKDVLEYSVKISSQKSDFNEFLSVLDITLRDMLVGLSGKEDLVFNKRAFERLKGEQGYNSGAVIYILEKITEANKRIKFNGNVNTVLEWLLFAILEGKYKWQKL